MTPLQIQMLLNIYGSPAKPDWHPSYGSPAWGASMNWLIEEKLVDYADGIPVLTDRGRAYVCFVCTLPLPVANWTIPGAWNPSLPPEPTQ